MTTSIAFTLEDAVAVGAQNVLDAFIAQFHQSRAMRRVLARNFALASVGERHDEALASVARRVSAKIALSNLNVDGELVRRLDDFRMVSVAGLRIAAKAAAAFAPDVAGFVLLFVDGVASTVNDEDDDRLGLTIDGEEALLTFVETMMKPEATFGVRWNDGKATEDVVIDTSFAPGALISVCPDYRRRMFAVSRLVDGRWELHAEAEDERREERFHITVSGDFWLVAKRAYSAARIVARPAVF